MGENNANQKGNLNEDQRIALCNMHKTFLEALRHREQEILRFLAILAPALGGFIWLLRLDLNKDENAFVFTIGTLGVLLFLLLGAVYSLALGYNFRYVTLQLAKLESDYCLKIKKFILKSWLRTAEKWAKKYKKSWIPYCAPPDIIKVFWLAFVIAKVFVILAASFFLGTTCKNLCEQTCAVIIGGILCFIIAVLFAPMYYGWKLSKACGEEEKEGKW